MKIRLDNVRLAFPQLWKAVQVNGEGEPAFSASLLLSPGHKALAVLEKAFEQIATEKWGAKGAAILKTMKATDKLCLHDGNLKSSYDGFPGNFFVSARSKVRPTVVNRDRTPLTQEDGKPYSGCYVTASIELWPQDNKFGKRINAQLRGVQFYADGDAFAGGSMPAEADEFEDMSTEEAEVDPTA
jgi:hypothetical protein